MAVKKKTTKPIKPKTKPKSKPVKPKLPKPKRISKKTTDIVLSAIKEKENLPATSPAIGLTEYPDFTPLPILTLENTSESHHAQMYKTPDDMLDKMNEYFGNPANAPFHIPGLRLALQIWDVRTYKRYLSDRHVHYHAYNEILRAAETFIEAGLVSRLFNSKNWGAVNAYLRSKFGYTEQVDHKHEVSGSVNIRFTSETPEEKQRRITLEAKQKPKVIDAEYTEVK